MRRFANRESIVCGKRAGPSHAAGTHLSCIARRRDARNARMWNAACGCAVRRIAPDSDRRAGRDTPRRDTARRRGSRCARCTSRRRNRLPRMRARGRPTGRDARCSFRMGSYARRGVEDRDARGMRGRLGMRATGRSPGCTSGPMGEGYTGAGPLCPSDERPVRRIAERKIRGRVQSMCEPRDDPPAPSIEGIRRAVVRLFRCREGGPHPGPGVTDEDERRSPRTVAEPRDRVVRDDVKRATTREPLGFDRGEDGVERAPPGGAVESDFFHINARRDCRRASRGEPDCSPHRGASRRGGRRRSQIMRLR